MDPKATVARFVAEYQTKGDEAVLYELIHPQIVDHMHWEGTPTGVAGVKAIFDTLRAAFSGFRAEIHRQLGDGDLVATHKSFYGTHTGEFMGVPPTGRDVRIDLIDIVRVADGRIVEHWNVIDQLGLLRQLGAA